jgi:asparagine synthase (glutamine-hydrolysing)
VVKISNKIALPMYILVALSDRVDMGHSIEGRLPFLDHHLIEYSRRLPIEMRAGAILSSLRDLIPLLFATHR